MAQESTAWQTQALRHISLQAAKLPATAFAFSWLILLGLSIALAFGLSPVLKDSALGGFFSIICIIFITIASFMIVAYFVVSKSLFKSRKQGHIAVKKPESGLAGYRVRWSFIMAVVSFVSSIIGSIFLVSILGDQSKALSVALTIGTLWFGAFAANYFTAKRMIQKGDATLELTQVGV